ncbi:MAG: hypothetical protein WCS31_06120 [Verrucomicrobiae bacterium]
MTRPGITPETLEAEGIRPVSESEAETLIGMAAPGIAIPYHDAGDRPLMVNGQHFHRIRLAEPKGSAKYLSPKDSGAQLYIPKNQEHTGSTLVLTEGEFKALSLAEAGILAVGLGGITSALKDKELLPALAGCIRIWGITTVAFLGDSDTSLIFDFALAAGKIKAALPAGVRLVLPRVPFTGPKGIDDIRDAQGEAFPAFWAALMESAPEVPERLSASALSLRLLLPCLTDIKADFDTHQHRLVKLARRLDPMELDRLAKAIKTATGISTTAFKSQVKDSGESDSPQIPLPEMFFDGAKYFRASEIGFDAIIREDAFLHLRELGFSGIIPEGGDLSPMERAAHSIQITRRVHFAGPICGRPTGMHQEGDISVLATTGPNIIDGGPGDPAPLVDFFADLLGRGQNDHAQIQLVTFIGWLRHFRTALRNHQQHLPGQALALVGPTNCGKSLAQSLITLMAGGRGQDASLFLLGQSDFNKELWAAEHLFLDDDKLGEDGRESHAVRDRLKKLTVANQFNMHAKGRDAVGFRPIWRVTISANLDDESINVLPPVDETFGGKIIYLMCHEPPEPFSDGTDAGRAEFWDRLTAAIPAFLASVDSCEIPEDRRDSRFYVKEFHHPEVLEAINGAAPEAPLGELIDRWAAAAHPTEPFEARAADILEQLGEWATPAHVRLFTKSARHFGHQLSRLSRLPQWAGRIERVTRRVGGRIRNEPVNFWRISCLRSNAE